MTSTLKSAKTLLIAGTALALSATTVLPALAQSADTGTTTTPPAATQTQPTRPVPLRGQVMFNLLDQNGDGAIDQQEAAALQKAIFAALDKDGNGTLSKEEFQAVSRVFGPDHRQMRGPDGRGGKGAQMGGRDGRGMGGPGFHRGGPGRPGMNGNGPQGRPDQMGPQGGPGQQNGPGQQDDQTGQMGPQKGPGQNGPQGGAGRPDFSQLDTNGDGVISPDEFAAGGPGAGMMNPAQ